MTMTKSPKNDRKGGQLAMHTPPIVSPQEWEAARAVAREGEGPYAGP